MRHESRLVKAAVILQHGVHGLAQLLRQDRQRLAFAVSAGLLLQPFLRLRIALHKQHRRFTKRPTQVAVTDLLVPLANLLARRFFVTAHQPRVG